jgi:purine-binding chemotaxis protein CheW
MAQDEKIKIGAFQVIVFKQGNEEYALHIDQIKEVVITPSITYMPQTPSYIRGVANIRGNIIAIIDLEEKFNLGRTLGESTDRNYTLVVESNEFKMGILVREVPLTITVQPSEFDESVNIISDVNSNVNYIKGIIKREGKLIILIDIFNVMEAEITGSFKRTMATA